MENLKLSEICHEPTAQNGTDLSTEWYYSKCCLCKNFVRFQECHANFELTWEVVYPCVYRFWIKLSYTTTGFLQVYKDSTYYGTFTLLKSACAPSAHAPFKRVKVPLVLFARSTRVLLPGQSVTCMISNVRNIANEELIKNVYTKLNLIF